MPAIAVTFQSNLTASGSNSTVTSASTTKAITTPSGTALNITALTQSIATSATSIDVGGVDLTKAYALRFRNTAASTNGVGLENNLLVLCTVGGADRLVGMVRPGSMFGPIDVPGSGYSNAPTGWKLQSIGAAAIVAEIIATQQSDTTT